MRLLADENVHADLVAWLRAQQHDVLYAAEILQQSEDTDLLQLAQTQQRVIITDDKDFGELVFHRHLATSGVILLRLSSPEAEARTRRLQEAWEKIAANLPGSFVVLTENRIRIRKSRV
jgi:predicted nuclease of predicted toxin-antitoxin system